MCLQAPVLKASSSKHTRAPAVMHLTIFWKPEYKPQISGT